MAPIGIHLLISKFLGTILIFSVAHSFVVDESRKNQRVVFLSVLLRHGDRAPTHLYPNDPNKEDDFGHTGLGQLTPAGKLRAYQLGVDLRHLYGDFLGEIYMPYMVNARSTDVDRTKMSLLLVLSGLYPPKGEQIWNPALDWQPIPYSYVPNQDDILMAPDRTSIKYLEELGNVRQLKEVKAKVENFRPLMTNLTRWTGREINSVTYISRLFHTLIAESSMGLQLPAWAHDRSVAQQMLDATVFEYQITNYNSILRRRFGGILLRNIIETMECIANETITDNRKIQLFSGHESTLVALLSSIGIYKPHVPEYSSSVIIEFLQDNDSQYYINIRYYFGIPPRTKTLRIPNCSLNPCPFMEFKELMKGMMPTDGEMVTTSSRTLQ